MIIRVAEKNTENEGINFKRQLRQKGLFVLHMHVTIPLQGPVSRKSRKAIRKTATCLLCKAGLFICCKGNKNQNNCKVSCLETPSFWRYKENYGTRNTPEKFRDFRETGPRPLMYSLPCQWKFDFAYMIAHTKSFICCPITSHEVFPGCFSDFGNQVKRAKKNRERICLT